MPEKLTSIQMICDRCDFNEEIITDDPGEFSTAIDIKYAHLWEEERQRCDDYGNAIPGDWHIVDLIVNWAHK